ncbi:ScbR family autoregulator-binding transcription factor [Streptomyces sp. NPDC092296]|uniref:ScbR family autoregulator-binding transcription factor n=1 Tax=Streptomyces sp. NPDC092296 TaxID=3366012 RepID=UPI0037FE3D47
MQQRAETTRRSVLEAAAGLFDERGYAGTSISDISALSGRTSGAIYFHYTSKENLALAVVREHFATWPVLVDRHATGDGSALERLVRLSFAVAEAFRDDVVVRAGARLWAERKAIDAPLPAPFVGWIDTVTELLRQARATGELAAHVDPAPAAHSVVCAFFGLHTVSDALDGRLRITDDLAWLWLLLLPALQARPAAAALLARVRGGLPASAPEPPREAAVLPTPAAG